MFIIFPNSRNQCWVRDSFSRDETETRQLVFETETRQRHLFSESAETRTRPRQLPSRPRRDRDNTAETVNETLVISTQCCRRGAALQLSRMVLLLTNALHLHKSTSLYGPMRKKVNNFRKNRSVGCLETCLGLETCLETASPVGRPILKSVRTVTQKRHIVL